MYDDNLTPLPMVKCPDCSQLFRPNPDNEKFCSRCNANHVAQVDYDNEYATGKAELFEQIRDNGEGEWQSVIDEIKAENPDD
jgi:hypothetical protein